MNTATAILNFQNIQEIFKLATVLELSAYLWPLPPNIEDGAKYDFIIVGGGTAGCIIASRLAELNNVKVLLIEAGGNPPTETGLPGYFIFHKRTSVDYNVTSVKEDSMRYHRGGVAYITQGKMLGGSSSLNYMAYGRGYPSDYDKWVTITNDSSWSFKSVFPLFIKTEKMIDKKILNSPKDKALHGTEGKINLIKCYDCISKKYFSAYKEMGHKVVLDINERNPLGVSNVLYTISKRSRQSTANTYLIPVGSNSNLDVMTDTLVTKILFNDNKTAIGVQVRTKENTTLVIKANKEVIVTAGVFKTPQLLMLSGIGPKEDLQNNGIKVVVDQPDLGKNLQDHPICVTIYKMGERQREVLPPNPHQFGIPSIEGYFAFNKSQSYSDYHVITLIVNDPEKFLVVCGFSFSFKNKICDTIFKEIGDKQIYLVFNILTHPKSRGEIYLNSNNIENQPKIRLGYYTNKNDLENQAKGVMNINTLINTTYFKNVGAELIDPKLKTCARVNKDSKKYWKCYCAGMATTAHYYAGTCAMGTVLDSKLFVKGVKGLRVADASAMPVNVASPTAAAVMMIAQKASDMIIEQINVLYFNSRVSFYSTYCTSGKVSDINKI